jgi:hypothetical protein
MSLEFILSMGIVFGFYIGYRWRSFFAEKEIRSLQRDMTCLNSLIIKLEDNARENPNTIKDIREYLTAWTNNWKTELEKANAKDRENLRLFYAKFGLNLDGSEINPPCTTIHQI